MYFVKVKCLKTLQNVSENHSFESFFVIPEQCGHVLRRQRPGEKSGGDKFDDKA